MAKNSAEVRKAAFDGNLPRMKALMAAGCPVDDMDMIGMRPIHFAAISSTECLKELLEAGTSDVNWTTLTGCTALHVVCTTDLEDDVAYERAELLIQHGVNANKMDVDGRTAIRALYPACEVRPKPNLQRTFALLARRTDLSMLDLTGQTFLHEVLGYADPWFFMMLLRAGAPLEVMDSMGRTPLFRAIQQEHRHEFIKILLGEARYRQQDWLINEGNMIGQTPLLAAVGIGCGTCVQLLLSFGADRR